MDTAQLEPLDVMTLPPAMRQATVLAIVEQLEPGAVFRIINNHDPAPLRDRIETHYPGGYSWRYIIQGPRLWLIEISKTATPTLSGSGHREDNRCTCGN